MITQYYQFLAVFISLFAVAFCFTLLRAYCRIFVNRSINSEDYLAFLACLFFGVQTVLQSLFTKTLLQLGDPEYIASIDLTTIPDITKHMLMIQIPGHLLFWVTLWTLKFSFLFFYRRLGAAKPVSKLWLFTMVLCVLSLIGNFLGFFLICRPFNTYFADQGDNSCQNNKLGIHLSLYFGTSFDIFTDVLIMLIPMRLLRTLQVPLRQKLGLALLFSLGIIVCIISILRTLQTTPTVDSEGKKGKISDIKWVALWGAAEECTAMIVCSLPATRRLFFGGRAGSSKYSSAARRYTDEEDYQGSRRAGRRRPNRNLGSEYTMDDRSRASRMSRSYGMSTKITASTNVTQPTSGDHPSYSKYATPAYGATPRLDIDETDKHTISSNATTAVSPVAMPDTNLARPNDIHLNDTTDSYLASVRAGVSLARKQSERRRQLQARAGADSIVIPAPGTASSQEELTPRRMERAQVSGSYDYDHGGSFYNDDLEHDSSSYAETHRDEVQRQPKQGRLSTWLSSRSGSVAGNGQ